MRVRLRWHKSFWTLESLSEYRHFMCRNSACNNMCSKCYRDNKLAEERAVSAVQASAKEPSDVVRKVVMPPMPPMPRTSEQRPPSPLASREAASPKPEVQALEAESSETQTATNPILSASQAPQRPPRPGRCYMCSKKVGMRLNMLNHCPYHNRWPLPWKQKCGFDREQVQSIYSSRIQKTVCLFWSYLLCKCYVQAVSTFLKT